MRSFGEWVRDAHIENLRWTQDIVHDTAESIDKRLERSINDARERRDRFSEMFDRFKTND